MSNVPSRKQLLNLAGSAIGAAYAASSTLYVGGRLRFYVHVVTAPTSPLTSITVKVQQRYSQREPQAVQLGWVDTASPDAAGANSVEHTLRSPPAAPPTWRWCSSRQGSLTCRWY